MWRPKTTSPVEGEAVKALMDLIAALEDNDDVQNVYANFEVSDDALAKFAA
jgi:transcriptional/translational regulatory protein YebC/TACO1